MTAEKEAKRKLLVLEIEKLSFGFKQAMEEADKIEDPKKREKAQRHLWKKFWS